MTREELLRRLAACEADNDTEKAHGDADDALIEYINDKDIAAAYEAVPKWYA